MELAVLHFIQKMHHNILDELMIFVSAITEYGQVWIALAVLFLFFRKTRKCGISVSLALLLSLLFGNILLKNMIARERPFLADDSIRLLAAAPASYSFPSGHTFSAFAAAATIWLYYHKAGIAAIVFAALVSFSRMYLFVHYPTDILAGLILGTTAAVLSYKAIRSANLPGCV